MSDSRPNTITMKSVRVVLVWLVLSIAVGGAPGARALDLCTPRLLVLSAYPGEIDRLLTEAVLDTDDTVVIDGRSFFVGTLRGKDVVLTLTGIGLVNAERTTRAALDHFRCGDHASITGIVFSGVAGGRNIGDVAVPEVWTDGADLSFPVDPAMLATAQAIAGDVELERDVPLGDVACVGVDPRSIDHVTVPHEPEVLIGGEGTSADPFGGRAFPCIPGGGDVFGCEACRAPVHQTPDVVRFVEGAVPFIDPSFFTDYFANPPPAQTEYAAEDMETLAVADVATEHGIGFIAFRAASDGAGDPLMLPGFPFQFFVYRQLAADNAAAATLAFLDAWTA